MKHRYKIKRQKEYEENGRFMTPEEQRKKYGISEKG
jgi:hypothetical protein